MVRRIIYDEEEEEDELEETASDVKDMQVSEEEVDVEADDAQAQRSATGEEDVNVEEDEELEEKDDELEEEEQEASDIDELSPPPSDVVEEEPTTAQPTLKIKLKLPTQGTTSTARITKSRTTRRPPPREDIDIESEDPESEEDVESSTRSASVAVTPVPGRALTARQAALANVAETTHVSLVEPPNPRKKKPLTEDEIALKREETARKRKNLTEKKLEDEKQQTINRLLKKQSRGKGKRNVLSTADDKVMPAGAGATIQEVDEEASEVSEVAIAPPTMYRWVSTTKTETNGDETTKKMVLSFSVPDTVLREYQEPNGTAPMEVDEQTEPRAKPTLALCDVPGCGIPRKYRLVKDWQHGACGMSHLTLLESRLDTVA